MSRALNFSFRSQTFLIHLLWVLTAAFCWLYPYYIHRGNNYDIFIGVFRHLGQSLNLYAAYPSEYGDTNHYGPLFGVLIAPFALLPKIWGGLAWNLFNAGSLLFAINQIPVNRKQKNAILLLSVVSFAHSQYEQQSNALIAALIILSFVYTLRGQEALSTFFIVFGALIKLYPIVGLAFFVFSPHKEKFIGWFVAWIVVLVCAPMLISNAGFVWQSYADWAVSLKEKNAENVILTSSQDYSVMGLFRQLFRNADLPNIPFLVFGAFAFGTSILRFLKLYYNKIEETPGSLKYKLYVLASSLLLVVLFSTGTESQTYIIAVVGCSIWLSLQKEPYAGLNLALVLFLIVFTGLGPTDLFPKPVREVLLNRFVIMAWPCLIIWLKITWELIKDEFGFTAQFSSRGLTDDSN